MKKILIIAIAFALLFGCAGNAPSPQANQNGAGQAGNGNATAPSNQSGGSSDGRFDTGANSPGSGGWTDGAAGASPKDVFGKFFRPRRYGHSP